jgi:foldase protein PrsA
MPLLPIVRRQLLGAARRLSPTSLRRLRERLRRAPRWLALAAVLGSCAAGCGGSGPRVPVSVDGAGVITHAAFSHWMRIVAAGTAEGAAAMPQPPRYTACVRHLRSASTTSSKAPSTATLQSRCATEYRQLKEAVLGYLIPAEWVLGEAHTLGVSVSDAEVKKQFVKAKAGRFTRAGEFQRFLTQNDYTVSDLLLSVKINLLSKRIQQKLIAGKGNVTQAEIAKYYAENKSRFGTPEKRDLEIILTKSAASAAGARQAIQSGESFASVARRVSSDPTSKRTGGYLPGVVRGQEEKPLDSAVFAAKPGQLLGPIKTSFGYYVAEVKAIHAGSQSSLASVSASIRSQLASQKQERARQKFLASFRGSWQKRTTCRAGFIVMECKEYKAPKVSGGKAK